jgi:hypothetical protein
MQVVALDARNAFNSPERSGIAKALHDDPKWKTLWNFFELEYGAPSDLLFHGGPDGKPHIIKSTRGTRQGSTLGGFYFALAIHPVLVEAQQRYRGVAIYAYCDDITLCSTDTVQLNNCIAFIKAGLKDCSVDLNPSKCEWFGNAFETCHEPFRYCPTGVKIVGCFVSRSHEWASGMLVAKLVKHEVFFDRIGKLHPYIATILLAVCGIPRMGYYSRVHHPTAFATAAAAFDAKVIKAWSDIAQCDVDGVTETIAHLPMRYGGLGFTRYAWISELAYKSSKESADGLQVKQHALVDRFDSEK